MKNNPIETTTPIYTLGIASEISGIPVHSIRQYLDKGLIIPYKKESSRNLFSQVDIIRLKFIHKLLSEEGLNVAGIKSQIALVPCWAIRKCTIAERKKCQAFNSNTDPCWEASCKSSGYKNNDCRNCSVYSLIEKYPDTKSIIKSIIN